MTQTGLVLLLMTQTVLVGLMGLIRRRDHHGHHGHHGLVLLLVLVGLVLLLVLVGLVHLPVLVHLLVLVGLLVLVVLLVQEALVQVGLEVALSYLQLLDLELLVSALLDRKLWCKTEIK